MSVDVINFPASAKVTKVTSSNTGVLKVAKDQGMTGEQPYNWHYVALKPGKSTVTVTYKIDGKTYKTSATYTVKKYPNAIKSLSVNGGAVKLKSNKWSYFKNKYKKATLKAKLVPAAGWKIKSVGYYGSKTSGLKKTKNNASILVPKGGYANVEYTLKNKAGDTFTYYVSVYR